MMNCSHAIILWAYTCVNPVIFPWQNQISRDLNCGGEKFWMN
jgi:hypothetical protein